MAAIELQPANEKKTKRKLHANLRIDMTPMVDLGFLLISFFIFTTTVSEPRAARLIMPAEEGKQSPVAESKALTILLGANDQVVAYEGRWQNALQENKLITTSYHTYDGIGKLVRDKQRQLQQTSKDGRDGLVLVIKPTSRSSYKNVIDALDETIINDVKRYAIVEPSKEESSYMEKR